MRRNQTHNQWRGNSRRPRTISVSLDRRGQTTQDFAVGIGVFLLAIAFVFSFLPSVVTPFDSSVGGAETAQADRIADRVLQDVSTGSGNKIDFTGSDYAGADTDSGVMASNLGLRRSGGETFDRVNISIESLNESDSEPIGPDHKWAGGDVYDNQSAASSARIVTTETYTTGCEPACRLVVRVW